MDTRPPIAVDGLDRAAHRAHHTFIHQQLRRVYAIPDATGNAAQDTANIKAAFDLALAESLAVGTRGGDIAFGRGTYHVNESLVVRGFEYARVRGIPGSTMLRWVGASDAIALDVVNSHSCTLADLRIDCYGGAAAALRVQRDGGAGINCSANVFHNLFIHGQSRTPRAIVIGDGGAFSPNNEFHEFHNVTVYGYTDSGIYATGTQAYALQFHGCKLTGGTGAQWGLNAVGASVFWHGGSINANGGADVLLKGWEQVSVFDGLICEGSKRLLHLPNNFRTDVIFRGLRWANNAIHADGRVVTCEAGVLANVYFEGCKLATGTPVAATLDFTGAQADSAVLLRLCDVYSTDAAPVRGVTPKFEAVKRYFSVRPGDRVVLG